MSNFIIKAYRRIIPVSLREKIYKSFLKRILYFERTVFFFFKSKIYYLLSSFISFKNEKKIAWVSLGRYGKNQYPGVDIYKYSMMNIQPFYDEEKGMPYVYHKEKKLFFPKRYEERMVEMYNTLLIEQDEKSAHKYVTFDKSFKNKALLDIGAAEGIISLDVIENVKFVYLFEYDEDWIKALTATFEPWKDKVEIVKKYVSDINDELSVTLDRFFENKSLTDLFIKMDIEGSEMKALLGASKLLTNASNLDFSICVYHKEEDEISIPAFLQRYGYECEFSNGYLLMDWWLRKGVVRNIEKK